MQVFINDEEVLCNRNLVIDKQLGNVHSVILNNVYPKSWENDKDYVSRFYMPKDYSRCEIKDENITEEKEIRYQLFNVNNRYADDTELLIKTNTGSLLEYFAVIPNEKYRLTFNATVDGYLYEADNFNVDTSLTRLQAYHTGVNDITLTPTKNYIIFTGKDENLNVITNNIKTYFISINELVELKNNINETDDRLLRYSDNKILYNTSYGIKYMRVAPNNYYVLIIKNPGSNKYICETNGLEIETITDRLQYVGITGSAFYVIKPTKRYIVWDNTMEITTIRTIGESDLIFSGIVKNSGNINLNPRFPHYATLQALDYTTLLSEGDVLNYVQDKDTSINIIKRIVENLEGFMLGNIEIEDIEEIGPYNCNEKTPNDVFNYIAEITGSLWYAETISKDLTLIHFYSTDNLPKSNSIEYTNDYFKNNNIIDIKYTYGSNNYRNKQIITNSSVVGSTVQSEKIVYSDENLEVNYPIGSVISIKYGNRAYTVATNTAKTSGISANFYYTKGSNIIEINTRLKSGIVLTINYQPLINSRQIAFNDEEINRISDQTNRSGIISRYEKRADVSNELALSKIAQTYLDFKGVPEINLTVKSYQSNLFKLGNVVFFNGPLDDLKTNYLVVGIQVEMIITGTQQEIFYTYQLSSSFNDENAINFFDNQRRKLIGDIGEGDYIPRYIDIPSLTNIIFYDLSLEQIEAPKNALNVGLDIEI